MAKATSLRCTGALILTMFVVLPIFFVGCGTATVKKRFSSAFTGVFDTVIQFTAYADSQKEFNIYFSYLKKRMTELSHNFDGFNEYEGLANVYTINLNAGKQPVKVSFELYNLIKTSIDASLKTNGYLNIALGGVYSAWRDFLTNAEIRPIPPTDTELLSLAEKSEISSIVLDDENFTVFLKNEGMVIDVGATAKGYAVELVEAELKQIGCTEFIINAGGNICVGEYPDEPQKTMWSVGVQNPDKLSNPSAPNSAVLGLENMCAVTSGNYERYRIYEGKHYCHIINPKTLKPADEFSSVTVVNSSSALADIYSTALFSMSYNEGKKLADTEGLAVFWIFANGEKMYTDEFLKYMLE